MHREHTYDINKIRKHIPKPTTSVSSPSGVSIYQPTKFIKQDSQQQHQIVQIHDQATGIANDAVIQIQSVSGGSEGVTLQQIPHIAYFEPSQGQVQAIQGVGGDKKGAKSMMPL